MSVERELSGFALPFSVGISIPAFIPVLQYPSGYIWGFTSLFITASCLAILSHLKSKNLRNGITWCMMLLMTVATGYFIAYSEPTAGHISFPGFSQLASQFGLWLKHTIGLIPFEDKSTNSLITALITGERQGLSEDILEVFRISGASHILALSGLHIGIIYGIIRSILKTSGNSRLSKISCAVITVSLCGFYTAATGAGASITRAFLFIVINETATLTGRHKSTGSTLWTALFLQLLLKPKVITDIGFQLSYAAMAGIAYIFPPLKNLWPENNHTDGYISKGLRWIWKSASMSIACQITTGPLAWIYFGTFPQYFLITNMIAIPMIGLIIPMSLVVSGLYAIGICPVFLIESTEQVIHLFTDSLGTIATL